MNVQQISRENAEGTEFLETFGAIVNCDIAQIFEAEMQPGLKTCCIGDFFKLYKKIIHYSFFLEKRLVFDQLSKATLEKSFHVLTLATI